MKGLVFGLQQYIASVFLLVMIVYVVFMWHSSYFDLNFMVSVADEQRKTINLAQIILSSPKIAVIENERLERGVMDSNKLNSIGNVCGEALYPKTSYQLTVRDLVNGNTWSTNCGFVIAKAWYEIYVPLSIEYSALDIHIGEMYLKLNFGRD